MSRVRLCSGERWTRKRVSGGSAESDGAQEFFPNAEDASVLRFGISLKPLGARSLCVHKVSLEAISVGIGEMSKFGGI